MKKIKWTKRLTAKQLVEVIETKRQMMMQDSKLREGQAFFNALFILHPSVANIIRATEYDPFFDDEILQKCMNYIVE